MFSDEVAYNSQYTLKEKYINSHIITNYSSILNKVSVLNLMLEKSVVIDNVGKYIDMVTSKINFVMAVLVLYTNIDISKKDITKEVKKGIKGKFNNLYDCITYLNYSIEYAIRFNDDMKAEEFDNVFETLIKDLGEPDLFNEWEGYIWKRRGYVIALGLVSLNYNYEVPMICVKRRTSIFNSNLDYKKYIEIANSLKYPIL